VAGAGGGGRGGEGAVFGVVGEETNLVEKVVSLDQASETHRLFEKGDVGRVVIG
jgi:hypothetical protein